MNGAVRTYVTLVVVGAAACTAAMAATVGGIAAHEVAWLVAFAAAFVVVQLLPIPVPRGAELEMVRIEEALVVPMLLALSPVAAVAAIALGVMVGSLLQRSAPAKIAFNAAQLVLGEHLRTRTALTHLYPEIA